MEDCQSVRLGPKVGTSARLCATAPASVRLAPKAIKAKCESIASRIGILSPAPPKPSIASLPRMRTLPSHVASTKPPRAMILTSECSRIGPDLIRSWLVTPQHLCVSAPGWREVVLIFVWVSFDSIHAKGIGGGKGQGRVDGRDSPFISFQRVA